MNSPAWPHWFRTGVLIASLVLLTTGAAAAEDAALGAIVQEANDLKDADACDGAVPLYDEVVKRADPTSALRAYALYNRAVCLEELGEPQAARTSYDALITDATVPALTADARFRRGLLAILHGGDPLAARKDFEAVRRTARAADRALVDLQLARLDLDAGRPRSATRRVVRSIAVIESMRETDVDRRGTSLDWYVGEATLTQGDIWLQAAEGIPLDLRGPVRVTKRITRRAKYLNNAERFYVAAVAVGRAPWSQRALLQLGRGYLSAADALQALMIQTSATSTGPPDEAARTALVRWLEPRVRAQVRKAADAWVLCLQVQTELGGAPEQGQICREGVDALVERLKPAAP